MEGPRDRGGRQGCPRRVAARVHSIGARRGRAILFDGARRRDADASAREIKKCARRRRRRGRRGALARGGSCGSGAPRQVARPRKAGPKTRLRRQTPAALVQLKEEPGAAPRRRLRRRWRGAVDGDGRGRARDVGRPRGAEEDGGVPTRRALIRLGPEEPGPRRRVHRHRQQEDHVPVRQVRLDQGLQLRKADEIRRRADDAVLRVLRLRAPVAVLDG
mmetsp:Transcript_25891/g.79627  ORF Transcript_25891/g.79627 Transcript_25891/m.79627 type:complete len:218 (-) Transcript_25891:17-670(-)